MRQIEIKTGKATLLVVEFPEGIKNINLLADKNTNHYRLYYDEGRMNLNGFIGNHGILDFGVGNWHHIGTLDQMTEEVWKGIVEENFVSIMMDPSYKYQSATESGLSLLKANGILLNNKYQDDWDELCQWGHGDFSKDGKSSYELYTEEQAKVWTNPHIFIKQN